MIAEKDSSTNGTEVSLISIYAIIYHRDKSDWIVKGIGWSELHLFEDVKDNSHRLIAWSSETEEVVMNVNISRRSSYIKKTDDFHKLETGSSGVWGFGFYNDKKTISQANEFMAKVIDVIDRKIRDKGLSQRSSSKGRTESTVVRSNFVNQQLNETNASSPRDEIPRPLLNNFTGELQIGKPKPAKLISNHKPLPIKVSEPTKVVRHRHVSFDIAGKKFVGLPDEWREVIQTTHFGLPLKQIRTVKVPGYEYEIPIVLKIMKDYLERNDAWSVVGIFRLAPDHIESKKVREELDKDRFQGCNDINCVANCIKLFFRELPRQLLSGIDMDEVRGCDSPQRAEKLIMKFIEPDKSVYLWLLDLCVDVQSNSEQNMMTPQNLAICIAPNLFSVRNSDPLSSVLLSQKVVGFLYHSILWRASTRASGLKPRMSIRQMPEMPESDDHVVDQNDNENVEDLSSASELPYLAGVTST